MQGLCQIISFVVVLARPCHPGAFFSGPSVTDQQRSLDLVGKGHAIPVFAGMTNIAGLALGR